MNKIELELQNQKSKIEHLTEENRKLETSLGQSRENSERLHKESEMVITNVNTWVHEQR